MANSRIYLGIDSPSNLAISLELAGEGIFFIAVSNGAQGTDVCKFVCSQDALEGVAHGDSLEIAGRAGNCSVHPAGDQVAFEFMLADERKTSSCTLAMNSFVRLMRVAGHRAYVA